LRDASSRATKAFYPALSMCDLIFSGVFERHPPRWRQHDFSPAAVGWYRQLSTICAFARCC
jgi:hypothetical protein